jgi:hypothetical protein
MKQLLGKLLFFCFFPLPILFGLQSIVDDGLRKSNHPLYAEWNDVYDGKVNADLIVMGSSRAEVHISPTILEKQLKISTYNLAMNGWTFPMHNARFNIYLKYNKKPKYIVHSMDLQMLSRREELVGYQQFLPYLHDPHIQEATKDYKGEFGLAQYYLPMFKYNGNLDLAAAGFLRYFNFVENERISDKGYKPQARKWDGAFEAFKRKFPNGYAHPFDSKAAEEFTSYLRYCKENGIKIVMVFSPEYIELYPLITNRNEIISLFQKYSKEFGIPFLDYSNHPICFNKSYFYNSEHLNKEGSELFSKILTQDLQDLGIHLEESK